MTRRLFSSLVVCCVYLGSVISIAQGVRPVRDNVGFCWDAHDMQRLMAYLEARDSTEGSSVPPIAGISPHDDYLYAGSTTYPLLKLIRAREVMIFGVTHGTVRKEIGDPRDVVILDEYSAWAGPAGDIGLSPLREYIKNHLDARSYIVSNKAHMLEHSIEALLPFLQYYNHGVRITPVMVTGMPYDTMDALSSLLADVVTGYIREHHLVPGKDIAFLISSDANHYGEDFGNVPFGEDALAHQKGAELDQVIARECLTGPMGEGKVKDLANRLWGKEPAEPPPVVWCGRYSIPFGMLTIAKTMKRIGAPPLEGRLLRYSDTFTGGVLPLRGTGMGTTAPFSLKHWVGFFSVEYSLARKD